MSTSSTVRFPVRAESATSRPPAAFFRCRILVLALLLASLIFAVFGNAGDNGFTTMDDDVYITENSHVWSGLTLENIRWAFSTTSVFNWHPLTWISHQADVQLFGLHPRGHHLVSVAFHSANTGLLFVVLAAMTGAVWPCFLAAALFGLHPLHVESVAWAAERKDVLSTLFWFLTMAAYLRYLRRPGLLRFLFLVLCYGCGLMAKPMLVTLPFTLLLLDYWPLSRWACLGAAAGGGCAERKRPRWSALIGEKIPLFIMAAASSVVTYIAQSTGGSVGSLEVLPMRLRLGNAILSYGLFLMRTVWPARLAVFYIHPMFHLNWGSVACSAAFLVAISLAVLLGRRRFPWLPVGWIWFLATLIPVLGLVQVGSQGMADRYTYVPLVGPFIAVAWSIAACARCDRAARSALAAVAVLVLVALSFITRVQVGYWKDSVTLLEHTIKVTKDNSFALLTLGIAAGRTKDYPRAEAALKEALRIAPRWGDAHFQLGMVFVSSGNLPGAVREYLILREPEPDKAARLKRYIDVAGGSR